MAKYYVQSGTLRTVLQAESAQKAAVWAVHQVLGQVLPLDTAPAAPVAGDVTADSCDGSPRVAVLGATVRVSEQGFDRQDARAWITIDVVTQWNELVTTLDRLEKMLYRVAA